jgi:pimeloyl-ACP methyl ester carboxylesterase
MEETLQFGEGRRLSGILTRPSVPVRDPPELPVFVFFNAGLLHRVGPRRLYVHLARDLSRMGFSSLRVDLAGMGDSPPRPGLTNQQSVAADYDEILRVLESRLARVPLILAGLCSGADNAIRLAPKDSRVVGLVLLDPVCSPDDGFSARAFVLKYTNTARYVARLKRRFEAPTTQPRGSQEQIDPPTLRDAPTLERLRDAPTLEQLRSAFESIRERDGRVLSVFTQYALQYYNQAGQLGRVLGVDGYQQFCTEVFWPQAEHTYTLDRHRRRLIEEIKNWAGGYIRP